MSKTRGTQFVLPDQVRKIYRSERKLRRWSWPLRRWLFPDHYNIKTESVLVRRSARKEKRLWKRLADGHFVMWPHVHGLLCCLSFTLRNPSTCYELRTHIWSLHYMRANPSSTVASSVLFLGTMLPFYRKGCSDCMIWRTGGRIYREKDNFRYIFRLLTKMYPSLFHTTNIGFSAYTELQNKLGV